MDIDNNDASNEVLSTSNKALFSLNPISQSFKTDFTKKNHTNYSNSNLSKKINDFSKTMGHSNININNLHIYADNNFNNPISKLYTSLEELTSTDIDLTENSHPCSTEDSLGLDLNLDSNAIGLSKINSINSTNVTSFTTTANPIPIPVNSSSYHSNENRNSTSYSFVNSLETPTTLSIENNNKKLNFSDNINSLSMFCQSDIDFNNSLNVNDLFLLNNSMMALQSHQHQFHKPEHEQQSSIQPHPPTLMSTTTADPLLSHAQAQNVSFSSHLSSSFSNKESNALLNTGVNTNSLDNFSTPSIVIKQEPELESPMDTKFKDSINSMTGSYNAFTNKSTVDMDINLETDFPSNFSDISNLSSSIPPPPPPSQASSEINGSFDLNTMLSNEISNLHIHSIMDLNSQEASSTTSNDINILSTNQNPFMDLKSSSSVSPATTTATTNASAPTSINPTNDLQYSGINSGSLKVKMNNSVIYRKGFIKKPQQQQYDKILSNSKYLNYPLSSSLKVVKKEPGTKINYVKKKISMKPSLSSSLDTKLSNIEEINKKYNNNNNNNNLLHTPHQQSGKK